MKFKEYEMPDGRKAVFEYDENGVGKITLECMDMLMGFINDRKTESNSEIPNNCDDEPQYEMGMGTLKCDNCSECGSFKCTKCDGEMYFKRLEPEDEPMKTTDYCDICKRDMCEDCIADATNPYCVPSHYEINYEPKDEPKTQIETQNSNLTFEKRTMLDCYNCCRFATAEECIECHYEPTDEPQTDCPWK